jgi:hypothetical protein
VAGKLFDLLSWSLCIIDRSPANVEDGNRKTLELGSVGMAETELFVSGFISVLCRLLHRCDIPLGHTTLVTMLPDSAWFGKSNAKSLGPISCRDFVSFDSTILKSLQLQQKFAKTACFSVLSQTIQMNCLLFTLLGLLN